MVELMVCSLSRVEDMHSIYKCIRRELAKSLFAALEVMVSGADAIQSREMRQGMGWEGGPRPSYRIVEFLHIAAVGPGKCSRGAAKRCLQVCSPANGCYNITYFVVCTTSRGNKKGSQ